ncbi:MAG: sugar phosphate nucleotidyltransferase [Candidatus Saccharimonadales bacterium]
MNITKAIIPVAGWGTRRLPVTKAIEKCMMPIGNRPVVDYVVQDAILAGITDFYFVVNSEDTQLEKYYTRNQKLEQHLEFSGKPEYLRYVMPPVNIKFYYIDQDVSSKYGTAIPVGMCLPYIKPGESVAVLMGDDFIYNQDGSSELANLIRQTPENGCSMLATQIDQRAVERYGVIEFDQNGNYYQMVEHPKPEEAPSNLINISKYIFNYDLLQATASYANVDITGEYRITEPINQYVMTGGQMNVVQARGQYLDAGDAYSWLYANRVILGQ